MYVVFCIANSIYVQTEHVSYLPLVCYCIALQKFTLITCTFKKETYIQVSSNLKCPFIYFILIDDIFKEVDF